MGYEFTFYSVTEGEEIVQVCVVIRDPETGGAPREFSVISTTRNGSAGEPQEAATLNVLLSLIHFIRMDLCHASSYYFGWIQSLIHITDLSLTF